MKLSEMSKNASGAKISATHSSKPSKKDINKAYDELKDLSSEELFDRLAKEIQSQKSNGSFDYDALKRSIETIKTYLPQQTYENMIRIIESLK